MELRVIDFGQQPALRSQAVYHGIAKTIKADDTPVLTLVNPSSPYVCVGLHQDVGLEVDEEYCRENDLPITRRHVGGGAVFLDQNQMFFHFIYPQAKAPRRVTEIYSFFIEPVIQTYHALGVEATFRPVNDIHVNGRKIGGTGAASVGDATIMVGSFMFDFDVATMARCLKVPSEKFRDKLRQGMADYITTLTRELGTPPQRDVVKQAFMEQIIKHLNVTPVMSEATATELQSIDAYEATLKDPEWTYQKGRRMVEGGVKIAESTHLTQGAYKAPGGLIRVQLLAKDGGIVDLEISGDFTVFPDDGMDRLADSLKGCALDPDALNAAAEEAIARLGIDAPGVSSADISAAVMSAHTG